MKEYLMMIVAISILVISTSAFAQPLQISIEDGGTVVTDRPGLRVKVNENSSLHRTFIVINDPNCPVQLDSTGIRTSYSDLSYSYWPSGIVKANEAISALEIRYLLFDMFGNHIKTLSALEVADIDYGKEIRFRGTSSWQAQESGVIQLLTIVSFVGNVRKADGSIWRYREKPISDELNKIRLTVTTGALDPKKDDN